MNGKLFVLNEGESLIELSHELYENEKSLQELIEKYPQLLAGDQINPDNPRQWLFISREMGVPDELDSSARWYVDHLFIDQDAIPTLIEVKRSVDTNIRRKVIGQMLDYAANAIQNWPIETIKQIYDNISANDAITKLSELGIQHDSEDAFWEKVSVNLRSGKIRLIFAADMIPSSLQIIIEYLNRQMIDTEVLGLEIKQFKSEEGLITLAPSIVGKLASSKQNKQLESKYWDETSFLEQVSVVSSAKVVETCKKLLSAFHDLDCSIWWGRGKQYGGFTPIFESQQRHLLCYVYNWDKYTRIQMQFGSMKSPFNNDEYRTKQKKLVERISGINLSDKKLSKYPSFLVDHLCTDESFDLFIDTMKTYINDIRDAEGM